MGKAAFIAGAGGFIAGHLATILKSEGYRVDGCDIKPINDWWVGERTYDTCVDGFDARLVNTLDNYDVVFNLACDMGGMGFIESHPVECMRSVSINMRLLDVAAKDEQPKQYFYSSSACVYPNVAGPLPEYMAWSGPPDSAYGIEKLFNEQYTIEMGKRHPQLSVYIGRFHNVFGPHGTWCGGREKAPAALCRKIAECEVGITDTIEIWGDGTQGRTYLYVDDCVNGIMEMLKQDRKWHPTNIGSTRVISVNDLLRMIAYVNNVDLSRYKVKYIDGPLGVKTRSSAEGWFTNNQLDATPLENGLIYTYRWVHDQVVARYTSRA